MKKISRRSFLMATGVIAASAALSACGGSSASTSSAGSTAASTAASGSAAQGGGDLVIYSPNSEGLLNATIPLFEEKYGVNVELIQAGTGELVSEVTERAMRGELDFTASLRQRVATLKDADASILLQVRDALPLMPGLAQLVLKLETLGWKVAIASGGFTFFAEYLRDKLRLTAVVANELEIMDGKFTGNVIGDIVDAQYKAKTLTRLAQEYEIPLAQTVAIGDGANDLPMIKAAGLGIAYHAKPKVNEKAEVTIRHADLMGVFCILSGSLNQK